MRRIERYAAAFFLLGRSYDQALPQIWSKASQILWALLALGIVAQVFLRIETPDMSQFLLESFSNLVFTRGGFLIWSLVFGWTYSIRTADGGTQRYRHTPWWRGP